MELIFSFLKYPRNLQNIQSNASVIIFIVIFLHFTPATSRIQVNHHRWLPTFPNPRISYSDHCSNIVPEAPIDPTATVSASPDASFRFDAGIFSGGEPFFDGNQPSYGFPNSASFMSFFVHRTLRDDRVYKVHARLNLRIPGSLSAYSGDSDRRRLRMVRSRAHSAFGFTGFWSESTGQLCMVGSSSIYSSSGNFQSFDAVLKLNYSTNSDIYGSLVKGVLVSIAVKGDPSYFEPVLILGVAQNSLNYEYKLVGQGKRDCDENQQEISLPLEGARGGFCSVLSQGNHVFGLKYQSKCGGNASCSPVSVGISFVPDFMAFHSIRCKYEGKMQILLSFFNSSSVSSLFPFDPSTSLVAEGAWDEKKNRFCAVACRISNFSDALSNAVVDDCSVRLSLSFPAVLTIRRMGVINGQAWSKKTVKNPGYFSKIEFSSIREPLWRIPGLKYKYTEVDRVGKYCANNKNSVNLKGKAYPNAHSSDMKFYMLLRNSKGVMAADYAHASPIFVGSQLYGNTVILGQGAKQPGVALHINNNHESFTNISYGFKFPNNFEFGVGNLVSRGREISAEGTYNRNMGILCMIGCQSVRPKNGNKWKNDSLDCDIAINIKFSLLQSQSDNRLKGTIESTRQNSDPLYFGRIEMWSKSISAMQAKESVWRMGFEITMVLISNTVFCVLLGLQLYHVKKQPEALPFISLVMLVILTLGHLIPLLLNFEALFKTNRDQQNMFFGNDGWFEANEIVVRMVTMVAFLLEFRLLQLSWTARKGDENQKGLWDSDKKVLYLTLPLYVTSGLIAWLVNRQKSPYPKKLHSRNLLYRPVYLKRPNQRPSLWKDLKLYGGLIVDGFLLPQILFNAFSNSKDKALSASFYIGATLVRLLPHAYDLYRSQSSSRLLDWSYIYANHKMDYYSTAWDIIIPCGGLLFAALIFFQQQFGGRCILPKRWRESAAGYERVPMVGSVQMQGKVVQQEFNSL